MKQTIIAAAAAYVVFLAFGGAAALSRHNSMIYLL